MCRSAMEPRSTTRPSAKPYWEDFKGQVWARSAGEMEVLYFYPLQPGFHIDRRFPECVRVCPAEQRSCRPVRALDAQFGFE